MLRSSSSNPAIAKRRKRIAIVAIAVVLCIAIAPPNGPRYLQEAVSSLTGLPIDGYIVANFAGFADAVDLVGGLTVDVKARLYDPQNSGANFQPGAQHMNGAQVPRDIAVTLYGTRHLALHLDHLGFTHVTLAGGPTGANRVVFPASPGMGWQVARAVSDGNVLVEPGDVTSVVVYE